MNEYTNEYCPIGIIFVYFNCWLYQLTNTIFFCI